MANAFEALVPAESPAETPFARLCRRYPERLEQTLRRVSALRRGTPLPEVLPPVQVELHPGPSCHARCEHCTGRLLRCRVQPQPLEAFLALIDGLPKLGVPRIELSGIYTEPLTYGPICELLASVQEHGLAFGLHTKLLVASPQLIDTLARTQTGGSCVAVSLDYFDAGLYEARLRPQVPGGLDRVTANVERLCAAIERNRGSLHVDLRTLLMRGTRRQHLERFARWYRGLRTSYPRCHVNWRLSVPWAPTAAPHAARPEQDQHIGFDRDDERDIAEWVAAFLAEAPAMPGQGACCFRRNVLSAPGCDVCANQFLYGAIGSDGAFFPCQGISSPLYSHLSFGNLRAGDDFCARWRARTREQLLFRPGQDCPACSAPNEAEVNRAVIAASWRTGEARSQGSPAGEGACSPRGLVA